MNCKDRKTESEEGDNDAEKRRKDHGNGHFGPSSAPKRAGGQENKGWNRNPRVLISKGRKRAEVSWGGKG